jgi:predicted transcriptional regulator
MKERRTAYEVYWEILTFCREPRSFTSIINRCDLNSKIGKQHIDFLIQKGCLRLIDSDKKITYLSTSKAEEYIKVFVQLYRSLFENSPGFKLP